MHYKEISIWKGYLKAVKLKIMTAVLLLDMANKMMHYMLHGALVDTVSHDKTLPRDGYKPWELNLTLKIQQLLASNIVYLQCEEAA